MTGHRHSGMLHCLETKGAPTHLECHFSATTPHQPVARPRLYQIECWGLACLKLTPARRENAELNTRDKEPHHANINIRKQGTQAAHSGSATTKQCILAFLGMCGCVAAEPLMMPAQIARHLAASCHALAQVECRLHGVCAVHALEPVQEARARQHKVAAAPTAVACIPEVHGALQCDQMRGPHATRYIPTYSQQAVRGSLHNH